jgi:uncharacterized protein
MKHILITGGTGFIGLKLCEHFLNLGDKVSVLSRKKDHDNPLAQRVNFITDLSVPDHPYNIIINLAGKPLNENRWNEDVKKGIVESRIQTTRKVVNYIRAAKIKPDLLISGSAIGFYGSSLDKIFTEDSHPSDTGFTHQLCHAWEDEALKASSMGVRVCLIRTGIVLGKKGGALKEMLPPFKLGFGSVLGSGQQWMSWIHMDDVVGSIHFLTQHPELSGAFNLTAPQAVNNKTFSKVLAKALLRPCFLTMPRCMVKILFGEMGETLLLQGQHVQPFRLQEAGYVFKFGLLDQALKDGDLLF